jgi:ribosome-associated protein
MKRAADCAKPLKPAQSALCRRPAMIKITDKISISEDEITETFVRASGPGGQNVNKLSTAVELRFDVRGSRNLPDDVSVRLQRLAGRRLTKDGVLVIEAQTHRTQERNRADALARLVALIRQAAVAPKPRKKTKPSRAAKAERLEHKVKRGQVKRLRSGRPDFD